MKYLLVTGGVVSGLGKGMTASSIGVLLKACGVRLTSIKIDPYLNYDAGTMSPCEHGEVFVLDDGGEVDLDLGNYERFLDINLTSDNNITTGKIYSSLIMKSEGDYQGNTLEIVPSITDSIQKWIERVSNIPVDGKEGPADVCIIELGGTIGDYDSMPFIEALRQLSYRVGPSNFCVVHVSLVPVLNVVGEQKTKPTQHSVRELRELGLTPNILACRGDKPLEENVKEKLSQFCHVPVSNILTVHNVSNIWHIPLLLKEQRAHEALINILQLHGFAKEPVLDEWARRAEIHDTLQDSVRIALVVKYTGLSDTYISVEKALLHASVACKRKVVVDWVTSTDLEETTEPKAPERHKRAWDLLKAADGILVPGGFGDRGVQGKILAAKYARENQVPYLGICLGMQIAVIEFARSVLNLPDADSTEFSPTTRTPCVVLMPEVSKTHKGGTMRLGSKTTCFVVPDCKVAKLYGNATSVDERHRHRYEVNPDMVPEFENAGLAFVGKDETGKRMEIVELPSHPYFVGVQFHPEYKSRPDKPSAVFLGLVAASCGQLDALLRNPTHYKPTVAGNNGYVTIKPYPSGSADKPNKSLTNEICLIPGFVHLSSSPLAEKTEKKRKNLGEGLELEKELGARKMKYVLVTGGVVSGVGKGTTARSIGVLLKACHLRVTSIKIDPCLNVDAHGKAFVLKNGGEVDSDINLTRDNNITARKIFSSVINKEREGYYLGETVQVVPHITDAIQEWIERASRIPVDGKEGPPDICVLELSGTIGDIHSKLFIEALAQLSYRVGPSNFCVVHVSLVPVLNVVGEQKTKPTQHSVRKLRELGLMPNILVCRSDMPLVENVKEKLSRFCHVPVSNILTVHNVSNIWHLPLLLKEQRAHEALINVLQLQGFAKEPVLD